MTTQKEKAIGIYTSLLDSQWKDRVQLKQTSGLSNSEIFPSEIGISNNTEPSPLLDLVLDHKFKHVCQERNICFEKEVNTSALMLLEPQIFIEKPLAAILDPLNAEVSAEKDYQDWKFNFSQASEKNLAISEVKQFLSGRVKAASLITEICGVLDELFTNAVFNAPFTSLVSKTNQNLDRADLTTEMPKPFKGEAFLGLDNERIIIGVRDPFGTLNLHSLFGRIRNCYENGVEKSINMGKGGAGIGSYMVYSASASYYAATKEGFATIICCSIPLGMSNRQRATLPKNIHYTEINK